MGRWRRAQVLENTERFHSYRRLPSGIDRVIYRVLTAGSLNKWRGLKVECSLGEARNASEDLVGAPGHR